MIHEQPPEKRGLSALCHCRPSIDETFDATPVATGKAQMSVPGFSTTALTHPLIGMIALFLSTADP